MNWLLKLVQEKGGSTMRLVMLWTFFIVLGTWAGANMFAMYAGATTLVELPATTRDLLLGVAVAKVGQKVVENKAPVQSPPAT